MLWNKVAIAEGLDKIKNCGGGFSENLRNLGLEVDFDKDGHVVEVSVSRMVGNGFFG